VITAERIEDVAHDRRVKFALNEGKKFGVGLPFIGRAGAAGSTGGLGHGSKREG
jgi:hypothetical protein